MDALPLIILLVLAIPIALVVWLIVRAVNAQKSIDELSRRLGWLESEHFRAKRETSPAPAAASEAPPQKQRSRRYQSSPPRLSLPGPNR